MDWTVANLWLIPALPLLAAGLSALMKRSSRTASASLAIGSMVLAFFLSCAGFVKTLADPTVRFTHNFDWFVLGETTFRLGWVLDPLTAAMLVMITLVGTLIFVFSVGYMAHDDNFTRFFTFLSLFAAAMLGLVIANNLLLLFMCWELVGLASYLLIGFWFQKPSAAAAAKKAFITTRIGDVFFFLGILWLSAETGTLLFYDNGAGCMEQTALAKLVAQSTWIGMGVSTAIGLLIFCGAIGKSGQVPLHVWLPDAMEGPTPVSALIHAATMVAAGVFLVARVYPLMSATPESRAHSSPPAQVAAARPAEKPAAAQPKFTEVALNAESRSGGAKAAAEHSAHQLPPATPALQVVTWIGAITALFAALIAVAQTDIKRILAYSTVSQLGFMFLGLGTGGVAVGIFHLLTHAFFKALLFLGSGSVIHGCHEEQDIRRMGGLRKLMPVTFATYAIGMLALAGFPLLFCGFWSKDEILHAAWLWEPSKWPFLIGLCGAFLTAFYMTRQMWYVFFAPRSSGRESAHSHSHGHHEDQSRLTSAATEPHESPPVMTIPLGILAACTILLSCFGTPVWPWFHSYLEGHVVHFTPSIELGTVLIMLLSAAMAVGGLWLGWDFYSKRGPHTADEPDPLEKLQPDAFATLRGKFYIDELYAMSVIAWNAACARASRWLDDVVWDGTVRAIGLLALAVSWASRLIDDFVVNLGFDRGCAGLRSGARLLSFWQSGRVQRYLRVIALSLAILALVFIWGCK
ncbi:MAG TPA: proton-conducting transporter membrane subunit [Methylomirabilota bacterium]|nr:proton-conducting transporter membrane subunit [Methylomirabilota bacterium]